MGLPVVGSSIASVEKTHGWTRAGLDVCQSCGAKGPRRGVHGINKSLTEMGEAKPGRVGLTWEKLDQGVVASMWLIDEIQ